MKQYNNASKSMFQRLVSNIKSRLASIAFSGKLSDAENDVHFRPVVELTQEEYDGLPESKLSDGVVYAIKDAAPADVTVQFESHDEEDPESASKAPLLVPGNLSTILSTVSTMSKNIRYLLKMLGTTDISQLGDGTVSGALSMLNSRNVKLTGDVVGTGVLDDEGNTNITSIRRGCHIYRGTVSGGAWYKIAEVNGAEFNSDYTITFFVTYGVNGTYNTGILRVMARTTSSGLLNPVLNWDLNIGMDLNKFILTSKMDNNSIDIAIWANLGSSYQVLSFDVLTEGASNARATKLWTLYDYNSVAGESSIPSDYTKVPSTLATLQNPAATRFGGFNCSNSEDIASDCNQATDINTRYQCVGGVKPNNTPFEGGGFTLFVISTTWGLLQFASEYSTLYIRVRSYCNIPGFGWTEWKTIIN